MPEPEPASQTNLIARRKAMRRGHAAFARREYAAAAQQFAQVSATYPDYAGAHYYEGWARYKSGDFSAALECLDRAAHLRPKDARHHYARGCVLADMGRLGEAATAFTTALQQVPELVPARKKRAWLRLRTGDLEGATQDLERALFQEPDDVRLLRSLALARGGAGDVAAAQAFMSAYLRHHPKDADALFHLAVAYASAKGVGDESVCATLTRAIELEPMHVEARLLLAWCLAHRREKDTQAGERALAELESLAAHPDLTAYYPDPMPVFYMLGTLYDDHAGDLEKAVAAYQRCVELHPDHAPTYNNLGVIYRRMGQHKEALEAFLRAILCDPHYQRAFRNLCALLGSGDPQVWEAAVGRLVGESEVLASEAMPRLLKAMQEITRAEMVGQLQASLHRLKNLVGVSATAARQLSRQLGHSPVASYADEQVDLLDKVFSEMVLHLKVLGSSGFNPAAVNLGSVLDAAITHARSIHPDIRCETRLPEQTAEVLGDGEQLQEAFTALLSNAAESGGSSVAVTVMAERRGSEGGVLITIADDGAGIPDSDKQYIFNPGFTTKRAGSGFGLTIVRQVLKEHGGTISLSSKEGEGTTVTMWLPLREPLREARFRPHLGVAALEPEEELTAAQLGLLSEVEEDEE